MTGFWQLFVGRIECRSLLGSSPTIKIVMLIFGFKERPRPFCSDPRPRQGRHILAPRDPGDPATLPTLAEAGCRPVQGAMSWAVMPSTWPARSQTSWRRAPPAPRPCALFCSDCCHVTMIVPWGRLWGCSRSLCYSSASCPPFNIAASSLPVLTTTKNDQILC